jgi:hypothetical protein
MGAEQAAAAAAAGHVGAGILAIDRAQSATVALGFNRIVVSEIGPPNLSVNLV